MENEKITEARKELEKYKFLIGEEGIKNILNEREEKRKTMIETLKYVPDEKLKELTEKLGNKITEEELEAKKKQVELSIEKAKKKVSEAKGEDSLTEAMRNMVKELF